MNDKDSIEDNPFGIPEELLQELRQVLDESRDAIDILTESAPDGSLVPLVHIEQDGVMLVLALQKPKAANGTSN